MWAKIFRFVIGIALAYGIIHTTLRSTGGDLWNEILMAQKPFLLLAVLCYGTIIAGTIFRWNILLRVQGIRLRVCDLVNLSMIGAFFSLAIPGPVGGDVVKTQFLAHRNKEKRIGAIVAFVADRTVGLFGLLIVALTIVLSYLPFLLVLKQEHRHIQVLILSVGLFGVCGIVGIVLLAVSPSLGKYSLIIRVVKYGIQKLPKSIVSILARLVNAFRLYRRNVAAVIAAIVISVLIHVCFAMTAFLVGISVGENRLGPNGYLLGTQISNVVSMIPVTPGGIGVRDATTAIVFKALGCSQEKIGVIPVMMTLIIVLWRLAGVFSFFFYKFPKRQVSLNPEEH